MRAEFSGTEGTSEPPTAARRARGSEARLAGELIALADGHGRLMEHRQQPWASVTFSGTRHHLRLEFIGADAIVGAERLIEALPEHEFAIPRQLVADATVTAVEQTMLPEPRMTVQCELLLIDDA